jgi:PAS domain S-box-containing protein
MIKSVRVNEISKKALQKKSKETSGQKKAEENLKQIENRFRALIEKGSDMITLRSPEGTLFYLSPSVTHVLGYSNEELLATRSFNFIHPDDLSGLLEQTQIILKTPGSSFSRQQRYLHKNGTWIWCEGTVTNMLHEPGINALVSNFRDISETKIAELTQLENENQIQAIYTASLDAVIIIDDEGIITKWDPKSEILFGWKEKEVAGMKLAEIIIPERYREMHNKGIKRYLKTGVGPVLGKTIDISALRQNGVEFDVSLSITPSQINGKKHFIGFIRDISEKKIAEHQREFDKNNLNALINNTNDLMWSVDKDFKLITSNQQFDKMVTLMSGKSIAKESNILTPGFPLGQLDRFKKFYERAFAGETFTEIEYTDTPVELWLETSFYPIRKDDDVIGTACNSRDITGRKLAELERSKITKDLIQRNKDLEQFAYIVSHNLRAPVANILGASSELNDPELSGEDKDILNEGLCESVVKLDNVVKDLNQILQVKREISETKEKVYFSKLVRDIKISIKNLIEKNKVEIKCDFSEIDEFSSLKSYLSSIFFNLISNSIKYRQQQIPCSIEIKSHVIKNKVEIIFTDNGMGMDLKKRGDQVFGLYKRFHTNIEGKGMGLFLVKTQVETLGGKISVKSEVNKGTEFKIEFEK